MKKEKRRQLKLGDSQGLIARGVLGCLIPRQFTSTRR